MSKARVTKGEGEEHPRKRRRTSCDEEEVTIVTDQSTKSRNISAQKQKQYFLGCAPVGMPPNPLNSNQRIPTARSTDNKNRQLIIYHNIM